MSRVAVYKDRERSVAISKDFTDGEEGIGTLREVYYSNNLEEFDVLVEGRIKDFVVSGTAFNIFLLVSSRSV